VALCPFELLTPQVETPLIETSILNPREENDFSPADVPARVKDQLRLCFAEATTPCTCAPADRSQKTKTFIPGDIAALGCDAKGVNYVPGLNRQNMSTHRSRIARLLDSWCSRWFI
jgi:hypothetical protein